MTAAAQQIVDGTPAPTGHDDPAATTPLGVDEAAQFLYREARLADAHELDAWEALWTDDALYYVPIDDTTDPMTSMSIIFDNRGRIATRIKQLHTGRRHAQRPPSRLCRTVGNVEVLGVEGTDTLVTSVVQIVESRERGTRFWAGRVTHKLRRTDDGLRMSMKKVVLVDSDRPLLSLSFLV
jgi:benzoate/toluate 1,2-dioxygenase subunit beta